MTSERKPALRKSEIEQIEADARWWNQITERIEGWTLIGFTFRNSATFGTVDGETLSLTGKQAKSLIDHFDWSESQWDGG